MPQNKPKRPTARARLVPFNTKSADLSRAISEMAAAQVRTEARIGDRAALVVDLLVGSNTIPHRLGRPPLGLSVTPTIADASFAWAMTETTSATVTIVVVGVAQPSAAVEVW